MYSVEVLYSLLSDTLVKVEFGFVLVFHIHHSVDRVAPKCFVWNAHQPAVLADPTTDRGFFSQGTLFHGRRIGVRIVTHENRSREEWGSLGFFCVSNEDMQV